jgi:acetyl esterase/lipase
VIKTLYLPVSHEMGRAMSVAHHARHRGFFSLVLVGLLLPAVAHCASLDDIRIAPKGVRTGAFPDHPAHFPGGVTALPDVEFANLPGYRPLLLDLYLPPPGKTSVPLVVFVHGGTRRGDSRNAGAIMDFPATLAQLAARGFVVASVNNRLMKEAHFPAQIQDVKAAIRFLRANAGKYHIDPARAIVWGASAGGHLAAMTAATCNVAAFQPETGDKSASDCVQAAVIWFGVFDWRPLPSDPDTEALIGCKDCPDQQAKMSPVSWVSSGTAPMLLIHGEADTAVPVQQSRDMAARLTKAGVPVETLYIPGVDHQFIGKTQETTRAATLKALQATFDYIDRATRGK